MALLASLNRLRSLRLVVTGLRKRWLRARHGVLVDDRASISMSARFICPTPGAIRVGADSLIAFKTLLIADRDAAGTIRPITIGERCFIGGGALLLPGVDIGDGTIVGAGAVVDRSVPAHCIVAGNPAQIIRRDIRVGRFGRLAGADDVSRAEWKA